jgi:hypothetical protein
VSSRRRLARAAWRDLADQLESAEAWPSAREAWTRLAEVERDPEAAAARGGRAARERRRGARWRCSSARTGAPYRRRQRASAARPRSPTPSSWRSGCARSLARAAGEAERLAARRFRAWHRRPRRLGEELADAWIAAGDVARARAALAQAGTREDAPAYAWLALYAGDLRGARGLLRRPADAAGRDGAPSSR